MERRSAPLTKKDRSSAKRHPGQRPPQQEEEKTHDGGDKKAGAPDMRECRPHIDKPEKKGTPLKLEITHCISVGQERGKMIVETLDADGKMHTISLAPELFRQIVWDAMTSRIITAEQIGLETKASANAGTIAR